jgi:tRNA(adenine34) deaminase
MVDGRSAENHPTPPGRDVAFMRRCLDEARAAFEMGEVPVGALVVRDGEVLGAAGNASVRSHDPTAHAEVLALRAAAQAAGNYRLCGAELFVTVEPCLMCVGAVLQARLRRVVFACRDPKGGALGSIADFSDDSRLNHQFVVSAGVCEREARELLQRFFRERR